MSGHSKWHSIKHAKGAADAARGKAFARLARQIEVAARTGGGDIEGNPTLRTMVQKARDASMPKDNIERAIKRGTGELEGVTYENITYEGYATNGVAVYVETLTDNRNRTGAEIKNVFNRNGGSLAEPGAVAWQFERKGVVILEKSAGNEDDLMLAALEAGAEDIADQGDTWQITTSPTELHSVVAALDEAGINGHQLRPHDAGHHDGRARRDGEGEVGPARDRRVGRARRRPERLRQLRHPRLRPPGGLRVNLDASSRDFIREQHEAVMLTYRRDGSPQMSPIACNVDAEGRVAVSTRETAMKTKNLRRDPRVSLCVLSQRLLRRVDPGRRDRRSGVAARRHGTAGRLLPLASG